MEYIKLEDQSRHNIFVRIVDSKICEILSKEEFNKTGEKHFVN